MLIIIFSNGDMRKMDRYTILCAELRSSAQSLNSNITDLQKKAESVQKVINKAIHGEHQGSDLTSAYSAQNSLSGSITRLGEICEAMSSAAMYFSEASAELSGRANLTVYYMQHSDTLSYEGLMDNYSSAIETSGSAAEGYKLVKESLISVGYTVGSLGTVSNVVQDALQKENEKQAKRSEKAKWAKIGLTALVVVGGIAASAITGGAAAPIIIGAISGAVMAGGNTAIDQYAEYGWNTNKWNYEKIGKDAFVGGVTGAVTAWVGGSLSKGATGLISRSKVGSTLLSSSNGMVRVGTGAVIGSTSQVVSGVGSRGAGTFISSMIETEGDIGKSLSDAKDSAFDRGQILKDAALGGFIGGKQQYKEWKQEQKAAEEALRIAEYQKRVTEFGVPIETGENGITWNYAKGNHYEEYKKFLSSEGEYELIPSSSNDVKYIKAKDIEGVYLDSREVQNSEGFWTRHGREGYSREAIINKAKKIDDIKVQLDSGMTLDDISLDSELSKTINTYYNNPVKVTKVGDFYYFEGDGRHRTIAAQSLDIEIPVIITGEYIRK